MPSTTTDGAHGFDGYVTPLANEQTVSLERPSDHSSYMNNNLDDIWAGDDEDEIIVSRIEKPKSCTSCGNNIARKDEENGDAASHTHDHEHGSSHTTDACNLDDVDQVEYQHLGPSLRKIHRDHHTPGYLEGITKSKAETLQPGFNSGYPIGGQIGKQVGYVIGVLQGLGLVEEEKLARSELSVENLLKRSDDTTGGGSWDKNADPMWEGVHPVIAMWTDKVQELLK